MSITVNGETRAVDQPMTVADLLKQLGHDGASVAVAINEEFVARSAYGETFVKDKDAVEIVAPIQGG